MDFPPFQAAIDAGVGAVMVGHPIYAAIDPDNPASLSPAVLDLLRTSFGFEGVAMTDAFSMQGVREGRDLADISVEAIAAGEDLLIIDRPADVEPVVLALIAAVEDSDADVREAAASALHSFKDRRSKEALRAALDDENHRVRDRAASALRGMGETPPAD